MKNQRIVLAARPTGEAGPEHFRLETVDTPAVPEGHVLVRVHYLSLDPYMRMRMNDAKSYAAPVGIGEVMIGGTVGEVLESRHEGLAVGDKVVCMGGWQELAVLDARTPGMVRKVDATHIPLSAFLGAVGMPGVTAWVGLNHIIEAKPGETVVVSAASGAVGSVVGQLAKAKGCRVVGLAAADPDMGWRLAFTGCGVFGMLYAVPLAILLRDAARSEERLVSPQASPLVAAKELLASLSFILLVLYFTLPALAGWVVRDWMPSILKRQFGIGQGEAGVAATLYWQVAAIAGAVAGGWLADRWMRQNQRGRIYASAIGMSLIVPAIFGVGNASSLAIAVAFLILFGIGWGFFDCNNMPILSQIVRPELRATGYGIMNFVSISCGGLADWGFGVLRDRQVPLNLIFGVFASLALLSVILVLLIKPLTTQDQPR